MIYKYKYEIILDNKVNYNYGSVFHGIIMDNLDSNYVEYLHNIGRNPFNIFCYFDKGLGKNIFRLNILNDKTNEQFKGFLNKNNFYSKNKNQNIGLKLISADELSHNSITNRGLESVNNTYIKFNFLSPTSFKQNGHYINYPTLKMILSSISRNWDEFNTEVKFFDKELFEYIDEHNSIASYNLRSTNFYLEKTKIPAFTGDITYRIHANDNVKKICKILEEYSTCSGVGIKTSLGMGGL